MKDKKPSKSLLKIHNSSTIKIYFTAQKVFDLILIIFGILLNFISLQLLGSFFRWFLIGLVDFPRLFSVFYGTLY